MDAVTAPNKRNKVAWFKSVLIHIVFDRLYRIGKIERVVSTLPCLQPASPTHRDNRPRACRVSQSSSSRFALAHDGNRRCVLIGATSMFPPLDFLCVNQTYIYGYDISIIASPDAMTEHWVYGRDVGGACRDIVNDGWVVDIDPKYK